MTKLRTFVVVAPFLAAICACTQSPERGQVVESRDADRPVTLAMENTPNPPKMGANTVTVIVNQGAAPVTDAAVTGEFFMPVMESMGRTSVAFSNAGNGRYTGLGNLTMAGSWQVTVTAKRGGQTLATRTFNLTTKQ